MIQLSRASPGRVPNRIGIWRTGSHAAEPRSWRLTPRRCAGAGRRKRQRASGRSRRRLVACCWTASAGTDDRGTDTGRKEPGAEGRLELPAGKLRRLVVLHPVEDLLGESFVAASDRPPASTRDQGHERCEVAGAARVE